MTSEQLGLVAQVAPVFLLVLVAERVSLNRTDQSRGARRWKTTLLVCGLMLWMVCVLALALSSKDRGDWAAWVVMLPFALSAAGVAGAGLALFTLEGDDD